MKQVRLDVANRSPMRSQFVLHEFGYRVDGRLRVDPVPEQLVVDLLRRHRLERGNVPLQITVEMTA
jgi:type II secretory pathway predicted ATPase ExeA